ncbi:MAG: LCP family protein [Anaerolineales bacterium]|nr:LCP family protein [Anaerolineales bacterium]MCB9144166.1 LCP family protein [Anaerolineales bacterium]
MKNKYLFKASLFLALVLASCTPSTPISEAAGAPFLLVTSAPNASPTPTPFQPSLATPTQPPLVLSNSNTIPQASILASATPLASPTPTTPVEQLFPTQAAPPAQVVVNTPLPLQPISNTETINFLLIGSDRRPDGTSHRTDTLLIAIVWYKEGQVSLISIPRDTWLYIPDVGMDRINTAYQYGEFSGYPGGGTTLLKDTIFQNFGIRIDYTAMVEFDGFRRIVDTLGGIDVPIACPYTDWRLISPELDQNNEDNWWLYTVGPGQVHMDGDLALWYARSRSKSSDFDRGRRQQEVIRTIFQKALQTDTFSKIPQLYSDFSSTVLTDMGLTDMLSLAPYAVNFTNANIRSYYIRPPYVQPWTTPGGAAVLLPQDSLNQLLIEATTLSDFAATRKTITIEVVNGSNFETMETLAASRLNYAGYETTLGTVENHNYGTTVLVDHTTSQDVNQRQAILNVLGTPSVNILSIPDPNSKVQYHLIIGADYQACFRPEELSH